jgi:hypothetical protein
VRNVEATGDADLPAAATHVADVAAADADKFLAAISSGKKMILHLAEGTDPAAHNHFAALQIHPGTWAITDNLIGIHCAALQDDDFAVMAAHGGSMVWSPLSNLLLYGDTAHVGAALQHKVPVALGSDWAPSGSKNLLGELKVARLAAQWKNVALTDADLVAMCTRTPAQMLGWGAHVGTIEAGKRADLIVVHGRAADAHTQLVDATEADLSLVMINGVPRMGTKQLMTRLGVAAADEVPITVGGHARVLYLAQQGADPDVEAVTPQEAIDRLTAALQNLPNKSVTAHAAKPGVKLAVAGLVDNKESPRPHLPFDGKPTGPNLPETRTVAAAQHAMAAAGPLPALTLDPLTAIDNRAFYDALANEANLPDQVKHGLAALRP